MHYESVNSNALNTSPKTLFAIAYSLSTSSKESQAKNARLIELALGASSIDAFVIIPSVPSQPIKIYLRSYPVLSLRIAYRLSKTSPFPVTASNPKVLPCNEPYLRRRKPPALVERLPPNMQEPRAPRSNGIIYPLSSQN